MSVFLRQGLPNTVAKSAPIVVSRFIGEREIASVMRASDPFKVDDLCTLSPSGQHQAVGSCGDVVCVHCSRVF